MSILPTDRRVSNYQRQSGRPRLTARQRRRVDHKQAKLERLTGQRPQARGPGR
ncbi:hypothetical protein ONA91_27055 [Micromonospora sp. DR5-3]|uniref:hypothetical protein n=1 Tax=unclassified Micromonospora TaxID=2617518 RepID=UPI00165242E6|nr:MULTISPECIES: hypothetical protein [unclassified Micromonospora]MCW3818113.1 hypothetical protein [Micromonospora sp. DR5-3]